MGRVVALFSVLFSVLFSGLALGLSDSYAEDSQPCFNENTPPALLRSTLDLPEEFDVPKSAHGSYKEPEDSYWAEATLKTKTPLSTILSRIKDPKFFKDPKKQDLKVEMLPLSQNASLFQKFALTVGMQVIVFLHIEWIEQFEYFRLKGSETEPESIFVRYQKTSGTKYLKKFCGTLKIDVVNTNKKERFTKLYYVDEIISSHRKSSDMASSISGTLEEMARTLISKTEPASPPPSNPQ